MTRKKILFICGSLNQTTMMHKISMNLNKEYDCYFSPFYTNGFTEILRQANLLNFTILGGNFRKQTEEYLIANNLKLDYQGKNFNYEMVYTCSDLIVPKNIRNKKVILVQEGMTDPETIFFYLVKYFKLPRYIASTSTTGLSDKYNYFCVASEGYKKLFIKKGVNPNKIIVTGIPNFDNAKQYYDNDLKLKNYVLVATSDRRETLNYENRNAFIKKAVAIAGDKQLVFKLHPNEKKERAIREIKEIVPNAIIFTDYNINHLIANCDTLITKYSSVVYIGLALGKNVYSDFNINQLKELTPIQNNATSSKNIAIIGKKLIENELSNHQTYVPFYQKENIINPSKLQVEYE